MPLSTSQVLPDILLNFYCDRTVWWLTAAGIAYHLNDMFGALERKSRGTGSWYRDRQYLRLQGASLGFCLLFLALAIDSFLQLLWRVSEAL